MAPVVDGSVRLLILRFGHGPYWSVHFLPAPSPDGSFLPPDSKTCQLSAKLLLSKNFSFYILEGVTN
jgi:hypothetical protein